MDFIPILIILLLIPLMVLPSIIALRKNHPHKIPIILVNIVGLFFVIGPIVVVFIGWLAALVWCFIEPKSDPLSQSITSDNDNVASEIEKLYQLKEKGILSAQEFDTKKTELLGLRRSSGT